MRVSSLDNGPFFTYTYGKDNFFLKYILVCAKSGLGYFLFSFTYYYTLGIRSIAFAFSVTVFACLSMCLSLCKLFFCQIFQELLDLGFRNLLQSLVMISCSVH